MGESASLPPPPFAKSSSPPNSHSVPAESLPWDEVWLRALTKPSTDTFEGILRDPHATGRRANTWIFIGTLVGQAASLLMSMVINLSPRLSALKEFGPSSQTKPEILACVLFISPFIAVFGLWFWTHITQWFARMFDGKGEYFDLVYVRAAYLAPISIITTPLNVIPIVGYLNLLISLYVLILEVIAVKTVNRFGWGAAIASVIFPGVVLGIILACIIFGAMFLFIGTIFNSKLK